MGKCLAMFLVLGPVSLAQAHAFLDHADPPVGSTVAAPAQVEIWMTKGVRSPYSAVQVFDEKGAEVDKGNTKIQDETMTVSLPKLSPGKYTVKWKAESQDCGHKTSGTFPFTVK
jgi:methionine-rich copper-binding protein CopC